MSKPKRTKPTPPTAQPTQPAPTIPPIAVLTITFSPPLNQVVSIAPHFPQQMPAEDVLYILRRTEEWLMQQMAAAKANAATQNETSKEQPNG